MASARKPRGDVRGVCVSPVCARLLAGKWLPWLQMRHLTQAFPGVGSGPSLPGPSSAPRPHSVRHSLAPGHSCHLPAGVQPLPPGPAGQMRPWEAPEQVRPRRSALAGLARLLPTGRVLRAGLGLLTPADANSGGGAGGPLAPADAEGRAKPAPRAAGTCGKPAPRCHQSGARPAAVPPPSPETAPRKPDGPSATTDRVGGAFRTPATYGVKHTGSLLSGLWGHTSHSQRSQGRAPSGGPRWGSLWPLLGTQPSNLCSHSHGLLCAPPSSSVSLIRAVVMGSGHQRTQDLFTAPSFTQSRWQGHFSSQGPFTGTRS